ncbi:hypothetical protein [Mobilicoccus pelagius]|uniref:Uncharacterized protein n=1 Tax=Mobilicoccus pelagius NBRC 104925 TaxID=1089455 RepID=H5UNE1_9MICO|nr:hypothetical protein [Mobilicoccus pelagius]GAB47249.1 hypothetical protein MOPEL_007_00650 [Mobilicoccus pelagius NBRC 104925]
MVRSSVVVAGIDLGPVSVPDADRLADVVVVAATRAGIDPAGLVVGSHRIVTTAGESHVVLTATGPGAPEWQWWLVARMFAGVNTPAGVCVGRHAVGDGDAVEAVRIASQERLLRIAGRCIRFPGAADVVGTMTVGRIVAVSAIDAVAEVGAGAFGPDVEIETAGPVRPRWEFGVLTLHVQHEGEGRHVPFESTSVLRTG